MKKKNETITTYKAFDKNFKCRDLQYKVGKEMPEIKDIEICRKGYHACENPLDVLNYYDLCDSKFAEVEQSGEIAKLNDDSKVVSSKIKIKAELKLGDYIKASVNYLVEKIKPTQETVASGDYSQLAASGYNSQLAASGYYSQLAASGKYSQLDITGQNSVAAAIGYNSKIKGIVGTWITLAEYKENKEGKIVCHCVKSAIIDGKKLLPDTWYKLVNGKFTKV